MLYEKQNIQWKHYMNVLKLLKIYNAPLFAFGFVFLFNSELYLNFQQQQKTWEQITPSSLNENVFY